MVKKQFKKSGFILFLLMVTVMVYSQAQAIQTGIDGAANQVKGIFSNVSNLILMLGGIIGLAGGIRVYQKWNNGDHDINKELIGWGGSAVFLLLAGTTLKLFFGI
jgi:predicted transporter